MERLTQEMVYDLALQDATCMSVLRASEKFGLSWTETVEVLAWHLLEERNDARKVLIGHLNNSVQPRIAGYTFSPQKPEKPGT